MAGAEHAASRGSVRLPRDLSGVRLHVTRFRGQRIERNAYITVTI